MVVVSGEMAVTPHGFQLPEDGDAGTGGANLGGGIWQMSLWWHWFERAAQADPAPPLLTVRLACFAWATNPESCRAALGSPGGMQQVGLSVLVHVWLVPPDPQPCLALRPGQRLLEDLSQPSAGCGQAASARSGGRMALKGWQFPLAVGSAWAGAWQHCSGKLHCSEESPSPFST